MTSTQNSTLSRNRDDGLVEEKEKMWIHASKGIIQGKIIRDLGEFVDIELTNKVRVGHGSPMAGSGFRGYYAKPGQIIRVRKILLNPMEEK